MYTLCAYIIHISICIGYIYIHNVYIYNLYTMYIVNVILDNICAYMGISYIMYSV